jgi:streptogramin lyase
MKILITILLLCLPLCGQITQFPFPAGSLGGCVSYDATRSVVWYMVESPTGICKVGVGGSPNTCFATPSNVAAGGCAYSAADDKVYVVLQNVSGTTDQILQFNPNTNTFTATWNIPEGVAGTAGVIPFNGALYCMETSANKVCKVSLAGTFSSSIVVGSFPHGPSIGPNGKLRFVLFSGNQIGQIDTSGTYTAVTLPQASSQPGTTTPCTYKGSAGICFTINTPGGVSTTGQLGFMPDSNQATGGIITVNVPTASPDVWGTTTDSRGNVFFAERATNKVGIWDMGSGQINNEWALPNAGQSPNKLCLGFNNNIVFTEHVTNNVDVFQFNPTAASASSLASLLY